MAKSKSRSGVPNKHLHSRISFLQQAAMYLTIQAQGQAQASSGHEMELSCDSRAAHDHEAKQSNDKPSVPDEELDTTSQALDSRTSGLPSYLSAHLTQVSRKSQIRLHPGIKHTICKRCSTVLIEGSTCTKFAENLSKGGKKAHADVMVVECGFCRARKRWPVGAKRQTKKGKRKKAEAEAADRGEAVRNEPQDGCVVANRDEILMDI